MKNQIMDSLNFSLKSSLLFLILIIFLSCEDDFQDFPVISYNPCDLEGVIINPDIITDFECQSNFILDNVETVRNPSETPLNTSNFVGLYTDTQEPTDFIEIDYGSPIDLSTNTVFKIKVKTEISGELRVMMDGGSSEPVVQSQNVNGDNGWGIYIFDFSWRQYENHTKLKVFFNYGVEVIGSTPNLYYIDDLFFDTFVDPCENFTENNNILSDFECQQNYELLSVNNEIHTVNNPYPNEINNSIFVGQYTDDGSDGSDALTINFNDPINLTENPQLHIKIHSSISSPLLARLEGGESPIEINNNINLTNEWVNYVFDFSLSANDQTQLKIFFNHNVTNGTLTDMYYIDDLMFLPAPCDEPVIENCSNVVQDYNIISDWNCQQNYGIETTVPSVLNPLISCDNRSENVGQYTDDGTEAYDAFILNYGSIINLNSHNKLKFKLYSNSSIQVLAKLEGGSAIEKWSDFSSVNTWQEFSYDFSDSIDNENTTLVLFFNAGQNNGNPEDIYYIDELRWEEN